MSQRLLEVVGLLLLLSCQAHAFCTKHSLPRWTARCRTAASHDEETPRLNPVSTQLATALSTLLVAGTLVFSPVPVFADEYGVEVEAPTLFTGESVMVRVPSLMFCNPRIDESHVFKICKRRGPLGACLETEIRTETNDNDKAKKYFRDPSALIKEKEMAMRSSTDEGNVLIQKLKQQSEDNREKNELYVQRKTFENDQVRPIFRPG